MWYARAIQSGTNQSLGASGRTKEAAKQNLLRQQGSYSIKRDTLQLWEVSDEESGVLQEHNTWSEARSFT